MEEFTPLNVREIINGYRENMLPDHTQYLKEFDKFQQKFVGSKLVHNKQGVDHWSICPWSWESPLISRPDRCPCSFYEMRKDYVEKLIKLYSGTYTRKNNTCCDIV